VSNIKKIDEYIKLREFLADNAVEAEIETILSVFKEQYTREIDPMVFWGIECDNNPELRKITVKAEILKGIALIADVIKAENPKELSNFIGGSYGALNVKAKDTGKTRSHHKPTLNITGKLNEVVASIGVDVNSLSDHYKRNWYEGVTLGVMRSHLCVLDHHFKQAKRGKQDKIIEYLSMIFKAKQGKEWKENLLENRENKIEVPDLFWTDNNGREHIEWRVLREFVQEALIFKTLRDTDELLVYSNGIYVDARKTVRDFIHTIKGIDDSASIKIIREVTEHIKARTGVEREIFNTNKKYIPVKNGLYNVETRKLEDFDPEIYYTFQLPLEFDPDASYDALDKFLNEVVDKGDLNLLQEVWGYCLYSGFPSHHFYWLYGTGRNGKGVYSSLLRKMIGQENTVSVSLIELDGHHRFAKARLNGKLLNIVPEANETGEIPTEVLKAMTGEDMIGAEKKGVQDPDNFINFAKFVLQSNAFPEIEDSSTAFWDRVIPVPFPNEFRGRDAKKHLAEDIISKDTLSGLFNYALKGYYRLRDNDWEFTPSDTQDELKANMRRMAQPVKTFQEQWTESNNRAAVTVDKLYGAMLEYCDEYGIVPLEKHDFKRNIKSIHGVVEKHIRPEGRHEYVFMGIQLTGKAEAHITAKAIGEQNEPVKQASEEDIELLRDTREGLKI
jgi:P4 family phage/plasmid primase-like protien